MKVLGTRQLFEARPCGAFGRSCPWEPHLPPFPQCSPMPRLQGSPGHRVEGTSDIVRSLEDQLLATCWSPVLSHGGGARFSVALDFRGYLAHRVWQSMLMNEWTLMYAIQYSVTLASLSVVRLKIHCTNTY